MGKKTTSRSALNILGAIGEGDITSIARSRARGRAGLDNAYREGDFGLDSPAHQRPSYIQVSSYGYIVRPVARAIKIKHAGLNLETWATSYKLDR